ncbi:MAG: hypothetical protein CML24_11300 [Rhizobiales bacterium]|nr:hypothetical protein [Hyphomicrobiales bacterium]
MNDVQLPKLTPRDFSILEALLSDPPHNDEALVTAARRKLQLAQIVFAEDMPATIVTLGSRVRLGIDDRPPEERTLVTEIHYVPGAGHQLLTTVRGIEMLGLAEGARVVINLGDRTEQIEILKVLYQPEAEHRAVQPRSRPTLMTSQERRGATLDGRSRKPVPDDDPGPSAA